MIAVVVSSINHCYYCVVAHGQAVRSLSGDPELGEMLATNWRAARLDARGAALCGFAQKLTERPDRIEESDRQALRAVGLSEADIFDAADVAALFNMTNRLAGALDMMPNRAYHAMDRGQGDQC